MWIVRNTHLVRQLPGGRELHVDLSGYRPQGWYHRPGVSPLFVGSFESVEETKAVLLTLEHNLRKINRYLEVQCSPV